MFAVLSFLFNVFAGSFKDFLRFFQAWFKEVSKILKRRLKGVLRESTGCFKCISKKFKDIFKVY